MVERRGPAPRVGVAPAERELVIDFGVAGNSEHFRGWGWSQGEAHSTWTIGHSSRLHLRPPEIAGTYLMVMEVAPFLWKGQRGQRLNVFVNGTEVGKFLASETGAVEAVIPWSVIAGREWFAVTFEHPDAARPRDVTGVDDDREIAFAFERLALFRQFDPGETPNPDGGSSAWAAGELMMQFESLGQNCEFGLVQRQCGAEPLSLLRFASTPLSALLRALKTRFQGLGEPGGFDVQLMNDEYLVLDKCFGFLYHAWIKIGEAHPEEIRRREERHLPFLRRKLIEDLEEGQKIFVYHGMERLSRAAMLSLLAAMRDYGPSMLLWVELQDAAHPAGTVEMITNGLLKGYVDRFAPGENAHDLSLGAWVAVCRNAYSLVQRTDPWAA